MSWFVLVVSGVLESVWAVALGKSDGFQRPGPTVVFFIALALSMAGLAYAMRALPTGTSYAVWVAIGTVLTVSYGMLFNGEPVSVTRITLLLIIVGCVVGLKVLH